MYKALLLLLYMYIFGVEHLFEEFSYNPFKHISHYPSLLQILHPAVYWLEPQAKQEKLLSIIVPS